MCDGILCEKLKIIYDLQALEMPEEPQEYVQKHMTWTLEELKKYQDRLQPTGVRPYKTSLQHLS
jgi:hypothetical protein